MHTYGLPAITTIASNNYGPYQFPEKLVPLMILNALEGRPLPVYGDGQQVRDWLFVEDHCRALTVALNAAGRERCITSVPAANARISRSCSRCAQRSIGCVPICRIGLARRSSPSSPTAPVTTAAMRSIPPKLRRELGWQPQVDLDAGLRVTIEWYLANPAWAEHVTSGVYRRQRLGLNA